MVVEQLSSGNSTKAKSKNEASAGLRPVLVERTAAGEAISRKRARQ